jgi:ribosomal protein S18 acetylase RimI-like enzyme
MTSAIDFLPTISSCQAVSQINRATARWGPHAGNGKWNEPGQKRVVELALVTKGTSIIVIDGLDAGWLQVGESPDSIYLGQLHLAPSLQNRGIGTAIVRELTDKARQAGKALTLDVMKNNRARLLYERVGFRVIGESEYKLKMRWQENAPGSESK